MRVALSKMPIASSSRGNYDFAERRGRRRRSLSFFRRFAAALNGCTPRQHVNRNANEDAEQT